MKSSVRAEWVMRTWSEPCDLSLQPSAHSCLAGKEDMLVQLLQWCSAHFVAKKCVTAAIFCHKCGKMISLSMDKKNGSPSAIQKTSATASKLLLTFTAFWSRKEDDHSKYFKPSLAKRLKKEPDRVERKLKSKLELSGEEGWSFCEAWRHTPTDCITQK